MYTYCNHTYNQSNHSFQYVHGLDHLLINSYHFLLSVVLLFAFFFYLCLSSLISLSLLFSFFLFSFSLLFSFFSVHPHSFFLSRLSSFFLFSFTRLFSFFSVFPHSFLYPFSLPSFFFPSLCFSLFSLSFLTHFFIPSLSLLFLFSFSLLFSFFIVIPHSFIYPFSIPSFCFHSLFFSLFSFYFLNHF